MQTVRVKEADFKARLLLDECYRAQLIPEEGRGLACIVFACCATAFEYPCRQGAQSFQGVEVHLGRREHKVAGEASVDGKVLPFDRLPIEVVRQSETDLRQARELCRPSCQRKSGKLTRPFPVTHRLGSGVPGHVTD